MIIYFSYIYRFYLYLFTYDKVLKGFGEKSRRLFHCSGNGQKKIFIQVTYWTVCQKPKMLPVRIFPAVYVLHFKLSNMKDCRLKWHKTITFRLFFYQFHINKYIVQVYSSYVASASIHVVPFRTLYRKSDLCIPRYETALSLSKFLYINRNQIFILGSYRLFIQMYSLESL
jgi:hypothetical protein